jgi:hypothetical protein
MLHAIEQADLDAIHKKLDFIIAELAKVKLTPRPEWVSLNEYADLHAVTTRTVRNWIAQGKLDTYRHGSKTMVRAEPKR